MSLLAGAGGVLAAGVLMGVVLDYGDAADGKQHSGNRRRLGLDQKQVDQ
jgi:hypothetical protein